MQPFASNALTNIANKILRRYRLIAYTSNERFPLNICLESTSSTIRIRKTNGVAITDNLQ